MKHIFILLVAMPFLCAAQRDERAVQLSHYALDSFTVGKVQVKSGIVSQQKLNYNILTGEMIFDDGTQKLAISNTADVDTVFINGRKFIPVNKKFYELLTSTKYPLLMEFTFSVDEPGASVGYGNASATTNATSLASLVRSGAVNDIKLPDDFKVIIGHTYWIRKNEKYEKANSAKQLIPIFPDKKDFINGYVKANKTSFANSSDVAALVQQIEQ